MVKRITGCLNCPAVRSCVQKSTFLIVILISFCSIHAGISMAARLGDIDGDATVDLRDVILSLQVSAGMESVTVEINADVNDDNKIGIEEAIYCLRRVTESGPWVMGYYVGYQRDLYPPDVVRYDAMTHLAIGAILPVADGSIETHFYITPSEGPAMVDELTTRAHAAGTKVLAMVGGAGLYDAFSTAMASADTRAALVNNLVSFCRDGHGLDGLDLDLEPFNDSDHAPFVSFITDLRAAWPGVILSFPVGYLNSNYQTPDPFIASDLAPLLDQINIMSYGMAGAWQGWQSWHSSALSGESTATPTSVSGNVELYLNSGIPAEKLGIGIGFYGICYSPPVTAPNQDLNGSTIIKGDNDMSYTNIMRDYHDPAAYHWDDNAGSPYLSLPDGVLGCTYVSYDDAQSIAGKAAYVEAQGLGGAIVWTINQGYLPDAPEGQRDPLMAALSSAFPK